MGGLRGTRELVAAAASGIPSLPLSESPVRATASTPAHPSTRASLLSNSPKPSSLRRVAAVRPAGVRRARGGRPIGRGGGRRLAVGAGRGLRTDARVLSPATAGRGTALDVVGVWARPAARLGGPVGAGAGMCVKVAAAAARMGVGVSCSPASARGSLRNAKLRVGGRSWRGNGYQGVRAGSSSGEAGGAARLPPAIEEEWRMGERGVCSREL